MSLCLFFKVMDFKVLSMMWLWRWECSSQPWKGQSLSLQSRYCSYPCCLLNDVLCLGGLGMLCVGKISLNLSGNDRSTSKLVKRDSALSLSVRVKPPEGSIVKHISELLSQACLQEDASKARASWFHPKCIQTWYPGHQHQHPYHPFQCVKGTW